MYNVHVLKRKFDGTIYSVMWFMTYIAGLTCRGVEIHHHDLHTHVACTNMQTIFLGFVTAYKFNATFKAILLCRANGWWCPIKPWCGLTFVRSSTKSYNTYCYSVPYSRKYWQQLKFGGWVPNQTYWRGSSYVYMQGTNFNLAVGRPTAKPPNVNHHQNFRL